jgi:hypothetical protein
MKLIIAGSRAFNNPAFIEISLKRLLPQVTEVVCGGARGADMLGAEWGRACSIPVKLFPADWERHGKSAGYLRNQQMAEYADALAAFWDGKSRGTKHMINLMLNLEKPTYVFRYDLYPVT